MGLRDDEMRRLIEIEQQLLEEDPSLARRLSDGSRPRASLRVACAVLVAVVVTIGGLLAMVMAVELSSTMLLALGTVLVVGAPTVLLSWRYLNPRNLRHRPMRDEDR